MGITHDVSESPSPQSLCVSYRKVVECWLLRSHIFQILVILFLDIPVCGCDDGGDDDVPIPRCCWSDDDGSDVYGTDDGVDDARETEMGG